MASEILIVDDEADIRDLVAGILEDEGFVTRTARDSDTALAEIYKIPLPGFGIRGMDVDRNGVAWLPLDSGHLASFDRRKCHGPLNGPGAEKGEKCPEGFSFYALSGPGFQGDPGSKAAITPPKPPDGDPGRERLSGDRRSLVRPCPCG